eukprot:PITA_04787
MTYDEYTNKFLELLRYVSYLKEEKAKIQRFTSGLPIEFKDMIEFDEPRSLEEAIRKLKHCYEQSRCNIETKPSWRAIKSFDDNGEPRVLQGKNKATLVRLVTSMQEKRSHRKGCKLFVVHISSDKGKEVEGAGVLNKHPVLQQFQDVFPKDITEFPPHMEIEFSIELVLGETTIMKAPYRMSTPKLFE